jgi:hypothetical protein
MRSPLTAGTFLTMFKRYRRYRRTNEQRRVAELESENELLRRQLAVSQAECESLSLVVARDRERIKSEMAAYARATAAGEK